jgi:hypothetical protein
MGLSPSDILDYKKIHITNRYIGIYKCLPEINVCQFFLHISGTDNFLRREILYEITVNSCKFTFFADSIYFKIKTKKRLCCMQIFGRRTANFKFHCIKNKEQFWINIFGSLFYDITKLYIC